MQQRLEQLAILCFFALVILFAWFELVSADFGFHLKSGEYIWQNGSIPNQDIFSYLAEGRPWIDSHWLFQLLLYGVYSSAGIPGVIGMRVVLLVATFALMFATYYRSSHRVLGVALGALLVLTMSQRFLIRPELASFLFLAAYFYCLENFAKRPRLALIGVPLAHVLWSNMHGLSILGIAFVGAYVVGEGAQYFARQRLVWLPDPGTSIQQLRSKALLLVLVCLASLLNANGLDGILYPLTLFHELRTQVSWFPALSELRSPFEVASNFPSPAFFYKTLLAVSLLGWIVNARHLRLAHLLPFLGFFYLSLLGMRNTAIFAIVAGPITLRNLAMALDRLRASGRLGVSARRRIAGLLAVATGIAVLGLGSSVVDGSLYHAMGWRRTVRIGESPDFPHEVVEHLKALDGRFFNSPNFGSYLIWKLYPEKQVALDGRWEVYGESLRQYLDAFKKPRIFAALAKQHGIDTVVLASRSDSLHPLASALLKSGRWEVTLTTRRASVLERK